MTLEKLQAIKAETLQRVSLRDKKTGYKVVVAMGDEGLTNGSKEVFLALADKVYNLQLKNDVVLQSAEIETNGNAPVVNVIKDGNVTRYEHVSLNDVDEIITSHVVNNKVVTRLVAKEEK